MTLGFSSGSRLGPNPVQNMPPSPLEASVAMHARVHEHPSLAKGIAVIARTAASIGGGTSLVQHVSRAIILPYLENRKKLGFDERRKKKIVSDIKVHETEPTADKPKDQQ